MKQSENVQEVEPVNWRKGVEIYEREADFRKMIEDFERLSRFDGTIEEIFKYYALHEFTSLGKSVSKLKKNCRYIEANDLGTSCQQLQIALEQPLPSHKTLRPHYDKLMQEAKRLKKYMCTLFNRPFNEDTWKKYMSVHSLLEMLNSKNDKGSPLTAGSMVTTNIHIDDTTVAYRGCCNLSALRLF